MKQSFTILLTALALLTSSQAFAKGESFISIHHCHLYQGMIGVLKTNKYQRIKTTDQVFNKLTFKNRAGRVYCRNLRGPVYKGTFKREALLRMPHMFGDIYEPLHTGFNGAVRLAMYLRKANKALGFPYDVHTLTSVKDNMHGFKIFYADAEADYQITYTSERGGAYKLSEIHYILKYVNRDFDDLTRRAEIGRSHIGSYKKLVKWMAGAENKARSNINEYQQTQSKLLKQFRQQALKRMQANQKMELVFENKCHTHLYVAARYKRNKKWEARGWWKIMPGKSASVGSVDNAEYFYYAKGKSRGMEYHWDGKHKFYVGEHVKQTLKMIRVERKSAKRRVMRLNCKN